MLNIFALASMGLSITMTNVFGNSFLYGIAGGFDTLGPQAFGAGNYYLFARYFNRAVIIKMITGFLLFLIFYYITDILNHCGIKSEKA